MASRVKALVNPHLLVWARERAGLPVEEAARKLAVKQEKLLAWETATSQPTIAQARKIAKLYKRPLALFYLASPPTDFRPMLHDFRRLPVQEVTAPGSQLLYELRRAVERREIALDLLNMSSEQPPSWPDHGRPDRSQPDAYAAQLRDTLSVSLSQQFTWDSPYRALNAWRSAIEAKGILLFQAADVDVSEMRGASINHRPLPVILVNNSDSPNGRIFTAIHELVHISTNESSLCDLTEDAERPADDTAVEVFCNRVAGALLVPADSLSAEPLIRENSGLTWSDVAIQALARKYSVSREVVLRRLLILGRTSNDFYSEKTEQYRQEYPEKRSRGTGFAPPHVVALSRSGLFFTNLVMESYHRERITSADVSEYLAVRLKHLEKIEKSLAMR